jgi:uncharacterized protein (TIGR02271 family)
MAHLINLSHEDVDSEYNLEGYDCYDSTGTKLGDIDGVIADSDSMDLRYLVVDSGGWFSSKQFVVPAGDVREIDDDNRRVYFKSLTRQTLEGGQYPRYDESWWDNNSHEEWSQHERQVATAYQPQTRTESQTQTHAHTGAGATERVDYNQELYRRPTEGAQRLQLLEERLRVNKERYQAGEVRLGKRIVERQETVTVPVREERVIIERTAGSGQVLGTDVDFRDGETIEVEVMRERVEVGKEAVVAEEINVRKEAVEREERVSDTVRREELVVEGDQGLVANSGGSVAGHAAGMTGTTTTDRTDDRNVLERAGDTVKDAVTPDDTRGHTTTTQHTTEQTRRT